MKTLKFTKRNGKSFLHKNNKFLKIILVIILVIAIYLSMFLTGHYNFVTSEPYLYSVMLLGQSPDTIKYLGYDYNPSWYVGGDLQEEKASIKYIVSGSKGEGRVLVEAQKVNNFWIFDKVQFEKIETVDLEKKDKYIDLLK